MAAGSVGETRPKPRKRTVHHLDTPYSKALWPEISAQDQDTILELLCNFLSPIGQHRRLHVGPSKGKKSKRTSKAGPQQPSHVRLVDGPAPSPPPPEILHSVDVGFNSITRHLGAGEPYNPTGGDGSHRPSKAYSMVFVARGDQTAAFNCHFPLMIAASSKEAPAERKPRLVGFSKPCSERLSRCLGVARVSSVAICHDAPGAGALWDAVRAAVGPIQGADWLDGHGPPKYKAAKINAIETTIGVNKQKGG